MRHCPSGSARPIATGLRGVFRSAFLRAFPGGLFCVFLCGLVFALPEVVSFPAPASSLAAAELHADVGAPRAADMLSIPPEISAGPMPLEAIVALEDGQYADAGRAIDQALALNPQDPGLRMLRQDLSASSDPDEFLARELALSGDDATPADRFEAAFHQVLRLELERAFFRGDHAEAAAVFIARSEKRATEVDNVLSQLEKGRSSSPWLYLTRARLHSYMHQLSSAEREALWIHLGEAGPWRRYLRLEALSLELAPRGDGRAWLMRELEVAQRDGDPLAPRMLLQSLELRAAELNNGEATTLYAGSDATFPAGAWRDDFDLAYGKLLSRAYSLEQRKTAIPRLTGLVKAPWRNTTYPAMGQLGALLRRLHLYPRAIELYDAFHAEFPSERNRYDREIGYALYATEDYQAAVGAFRKSAQSPRGVGRDYMYIAQAMGRLPGLPGQPSPVEIRKEALKLTDFARAAMVEETRVHGWWEGDPAQLTELYCRLDEGIALYHHALLYPLTFLTIGLQALLELLIMALGLVVFVSFPRLSRRAWKVSLAGAGAAVAIPIVAMATTLPMPFSGAADVAWAVQAMVRLFFVLAGAIVLSPVVGLRGLELTRAFGRSWRRKRVLEWLKAAWPVALVALILVATALLAHRFGRAPTLYLERLPTLVTGGELGAVEAEVGPLARFSLLLYHVVRTELLARGFLLAVLAFLLRRLKYGTTLAVVTAAVVWTLLTAGSMEPAGSQMAVAMTQGLLLGWVRVRQGVDGALAAHVVACLATGGVA